MRISGFVAKYGKRLSRSIFELMDKNLLDEFLQDCKNLDVSFDNKKPYCLVVKSHIDAFRLVTNPSYYAESTLLVLGGYVSEIEKKSFNDLNHAPLKNYNGKCILIFDASPEAQTTAELLMQNYSNVKFYSLPYGVSVRDPFLDEQTLFHVILNIIYEDKTNLAKNVE